MPGSRKKARVPKDLILQAVDGDRRAYGEIIRLCYKDVYDYIIRRVGNRSDAEDLTQTVFMRGLEAISKYEERGSPITMWFYRIAHNVIVDHFRVQRKDIDIEELPEIADAGIDIIEIILSEEVSEEMRSRLLRFLPPRQRAVIVLKDYKDLQYSEIGQVLQISETNAKTIHFRAIENLRRGYLLEMNEAGLSVEEISSEFNEMTATQVREELDEAIRWRLRNGYVLELHEREFSVKRIAEIIGRDVSDVRMLLKQALADRSDEEEA
ncbi:MAG: sigma-70 family RNA polymerase sigma factor [Actinobacteria bacterium]|nr:sigma-70 family RNA polymerase sigma factor [Actinomycetota bacterium]MBU4403211.1 sigma-70 family RNA polymerase sigma factor [Actinomycetota bacterium]